MRRNVADYLIERLSVWKVRRLFGYPGDGINAIGAKNAHPDRAVIACVGDGAMRMNGLHELITAGKYWRARASTR